jgi:hypothetical protein
MTYQQFLIGLAIASVVSIAGLFGLHSALVIGYAMPLVIGMAIMLAIICVLMFWLGKRTAGSENKFLFGNIFMGMTGLKMFMCAGALVSYIMLAQPPNSMFVIPVFFVYIVYTVLEVVALVKLSAEAK